MYALAVATTDHFDRDTNASISKSDKIISIGCQTIQFLVSFLFHLFIIGSYVKRWLIRIINAYDSFLTELHFIDADGDAN